MVEHVQPIADRGIAAPSPDAGSLRTRGARLAAWSLRETLLFPVVALYVVTLALNLPRELFSDGWYAILGGSEVVRHGLPMHDTLAIWSHGREWVDQQWLRPPLFLRPSHLRGAQLS